MRTTLVLLALLFSTAAMAAAQPPLASATPPPPLGPLTLTPTVVACTDVPTTSSPATDLRVLGLHNGDRRLNAARGDVVVLNGGTPQGFAIGQQYFTRRVRKPSDHGPVTAENPAAVLTSGWLTVVAADARFSLARIDQSCVAIEAGDYLEPYVEPVLPTTVGEPGRTEFNELGRVLFGIWRRSAFGAGDLLSIDRGSSKGLTIGTRVAFYRDRRNGMPLVELAEGIVIEVSADSAKVVLERAAMEIRQGDLYGIRGRP
jgi:hypothetical protein